jgi:hypothetical protein
LPNVTMIELSLDLTQGNPRRRQADEGLGADAVDLLGALDAVFDAPVGATRRGIIKYSPPPSASFLPGAAFATKALIALSERLPTILSAMNISRFDFL